MMNDRHAGILPKVCYLTAAVLLAVLSGCYRSPDTTWHTPHVYKGAADPLRSRLLARDLQQQLQERFRMVQTDR